MAFTYDELDRTLRAMLQDRSVEQFEQRTNALERRIELRALVGGKWVEDHIDERELLANCRSRQAIMNFLHEIIDRMAPIPKPMTDYLMAATSVQMPVSYRAPVRVCSYCGRDRKENPCEGCGDNHVA